jgi:AcrR family transcriptional regulator
MARQQRWGNNARENDPESGRDRILEAARRCYQKQGIASTTLGDIAGEANITRRTVYRYFENKQAIIQAVVDGQALGFLQQMKSAVQDDSLRFPDQLQLYIIFLVEHGQQAPGYQLLLGKKNIAASGQYYLASKETYKLLGGLIRKPFQQALERKEIHRDLDFDELMAWIGRVVFSYIQVPVTGEALEKQVADFVIPSILPRETD